MRKLYLLFAILACTLSAANAQSYHLDSSFNGNGIDIIRPDVPSPILFQHNITQMSVMSDGRIVMSGTISGFNWFEIIRLRPDGTPDSSFNNDGILTFNISTEVDILTQLKVDTAGNIFLGGTAYTGPSSDFCVYKITAQGHFDTTFGINGKVEAALNYSNTGESIDLQSDGKLVMGGYTKDNTTGVYEYCLLRLLTDGTLDNTYGTSGYAVCPYSQLFQSSPIANMGYNVSCLAGNKTILSGNYNTTYANLFIVRYDSTGNPDSSYGVNGLVQVVVDSSNLLALRQVTDSSGNAYELCQYIKLADQHLVAIKIKAAGAMDSTYGVIGLASLNSLQFTFPYTYWNMFLQTGGKLLVAGTEDTGINARYAVSRLTASGATDTSFGTAGTLSIYRGMNDHCNTGALESNGDILLAGDGQKSLSNDTTYAICIRLTDKIKTAAPEVEKQQICVTAYPNPATDGKYSIHCIVPPSVAFLHLVLSDITGKLLASSTVRITSNSVFDYELPTGCPAGTYLLTAIAPDGHSVTLKLTSL